MHKAIEKTAPTNRVMVGLSGPAKTSKAMAAKEKEKSKKDSKEDHSTTLHVALALCQLTTASQCLVSPAPSPTNSELSLGFMNFEDGEGVEFVPVTKTRLLI